MKSEVTIIRGGTVVTETGIENADLAIDGEQIVAIGSDLDQSPARVVEAGGCFLLPGIIDAHVHFNEPGRTEWEGFATGSCALAAGGGTVFFDMPLNSDPPTLTAAAFQEKVRLGKLKSVLDFALWGGLTPENLSHLDELAAAGAIGFKAFLSDSGIREFQRADEKTLKQGMKVARRHGLVVAVHAEDQSLTAELAAAAKSAGRTGPIDYCRSRPVEAELNAIRLVLDLAGETGCGLHLVHVSSAPGVELARAARLQGVDVTIETCPHYLLLSEDDLDRIGPAAKCAPPVRNRAERDQLNSCLLKGWIGTLGSDHSPAPWDRKTSADWFAVWGGISGCQHGFVLALDVLRQRDPASAYSTFARITASQVARRFGLCPAKGVLRPGSDADFILVEEGPLRTITTADLLYRHKFSPYVGRAIGLAVRETWVRGVPVWQRGRCGTMRPGKWLHGPRSREG